MNEEDLLKARIQEMMSVNKTLADDLKSVLKHNGMKMPSTMRLLLSVASNPSPANINAFYRFCNPVLKRIKRSTSGFYKPSIGDPIGGPMKAGFTELGMPFALAPSDSHVLVLGMTRSGKSVFLLLTMAQAMRLPNVVCWIFTRAYDTRLLYLFNKNIACVTFDGQIGYNPLVDENGKMKDSLNAFLDVLVQADGVFDGTDANMEMHIAKLRVCSKDMKGCPSVHDLYSQILDEKAHAGSRKDNYKQSCLNRLGGLLSGNLSRFITGGKGHFYQLVNTHTIFEMQKLKYSERIKVVNWMIIDLFDYKLHHPEINIWHMFALEDSQPLLNKDFEHRADMKKPIIADLLDTCAKAGMQGIILTQSLGSIMGCAVSESATKVMLRSDVDDIKIMLSKMGVTDKEMLSSCFGLPDRKGVIYLGNRGLPPFMFTIPELPINFKEDFKRFNDDWIRESNAGLLNLEEGKEENAVYEQQPDNDGVTDKEKEDADKEGSQKPAQYEITEEDRNVMFAVHVRRFTASLGDLAEILRFSMAKVSRIANRLADNGFLGLIDILIGKKHFKYPVLTDEKGYPSIGVKPEPPESRGGGYEHIIRQYMLFSRFENLGDGVKVEKEMFVGKHNADIGIRYMKPKIMTLVIEVAVSSANEFNNIKAGLESGCYVVIACSTKKVFEEVLEIAEKSFKEFIDKKLVVCMFGDVYESGDPRLLFENL